MSRRVRCPRCDNPIYFDEALLTDGIGLQLHCNECGRNFSIRKKASVEEGEKPDREVVASIRVLENSYCFAQNFPLYLGENIVGRRNKGNTIEVPIDSGDDDLARNHCKIEVKRLKSGNLRYILSDFANRKGTYYMGRPIPQGEQIYIELGDMVVCGHTTFFLAPLEEGCE